MSFRKLIRNLRKRAEAMAEVQFEGIVEYDKEDGGKALIATIEEGNDEDSEAGMFVRVQSWDETGEHKDAKRFEGKRVRVTVRTIEDDLLPTPDPKAAVKKMIDALADYPSCTITDLFGHDEKFMRAFRAMKVIAARTP